MVRGEVQLSEQVASGTLSHPALRRYLLAALLVRLADEGARVALVLLALQRTSSAAVGGILLGALLIPHVVAAPAVGLLTDRVRQPRWVLAAAATGFAASLACVVATLGHLPLWLTVIVLLAGGCCGPALTGGLTSQLSDLVPAQALPRAFGADSLSYNISSIGGPALAATLASQLHPAAATLALAASAGLGAAVLLTLPTPVRRSIVDRPRTAGVTAGVSAIIGNYVLGRVTAFSSLGQLGPGALPVVAAVVASRQNQPAAAGWLLTATALGGLVGSVLWTWRPGSETRAPMIVMISLIGSGMPVALAAAVSSLPLTAALFGLSGVFIGPFTGALFLTRQQHAPEGVQAQVFTIGAGLKTTMTAVGAAIGGTLAGLPTTTLLLLVGCSPILAGALGALTLGSAGRRHRAERSASRGVAGVG